MEKQEVYAILNEAYFSEDCHEKETLAALLPLLTDKKCFVDIGASLGQYTRFANHHMQNGVIYSIEADPIRFEELQRNCKKWEKTSTNQLIPVHAAVSDEAGTITFFSTNSNTSGGLFVRNGAEANWEEVTVPSITLDEFLGDKNPDFVKMDIEGSELRALRGATKILRARRALFFVEVHSWADPKGQQSDREVYDFMDREGYIMKSLGGRPLFQPKAPDNQRRLPTTPEEDGLLPSLGQVQRMILKQKADPITKYHRVLFNRLERGLFRVAAARNKRELFFEQYERIKPRRRDMTRFHNKHRGERCFIMGGGPSLKKIDPSKLKNEHTFGVNGIFLLYDWLGFQPTYYCVEDWLVYEDRFDDIKKRVTSPTCFFPIQFSCPEFDRPNHNYFRAIYEFSSRPDWPNFSEDAAKLMWIGGTVTYICIQMAFYMGFQEVYLTGLDHNYVKPQHVETDGNQWMAHGDDPNHFDPGYFGKGYRCHDPRTDRMEQAYVKARQVYERAGRKICNATVGGKLEVFQRVDFNSLF